MHKIAKTTPGKNLASSSNWTWAVMQGKSPALLEQFVHDFQITKSMINHLILPKQFLPWSVLAQNVQCLFQMHPANPHQIIPNKYI